MMQEHTERCIIRFSGQGQKHYCSEVVDTVEQARWAVCPAELDEKRCCANCGFCMAGDRSLSLLKHGA